MTTEIIAVLTAENDNLKKQVENVVNQANGFVAQLDAHKGMLSESITSCLNIRTVLITTQKMLQAANEELHKSKATSKGLTDQVAILEAKINELTSLEAPIAA